MIRTIADLTDALLPIGENLTTAVGHPHREYWSDPMASKVRTGTTYQDRKVVLGFIDMEPEAGIDVYVQAGNDVTLAEMDIRTDVSNWKPEELTALVRALVLPVLDHDHED